MQKEEAKLIKQFFGYCNDFALIGLSLTGFQQALAHFEITMKTANFQL
jgi:hypothetical protein